VFEDVMQKYNNGILNASFRPIGKLKGVLKLSKMGFTYCLKKTGPTVFEINEKTNNTKILKFAMIHSEYWEHE